MKLGYQIATPDVNLSWGVTAYQADLDTSFKTLKTLGYDGAELMVARPSDIDADELIYLARKYSLPIPMICTGELFGQERLSFSDASDDVRNKAISEAKAAIRLAEKVGAPFINIGRLRGGLTLNGDHEEEKKRSLDGLKQVAAFGETLGIYVLLEPVNSIASTFINSTQEGLAALRTVGEPYLQLMLDTNHMYLDDKDMLASVDDAKGAVRFVHLVDSNRLYPGNCKLDFPAFLKKMSETGYSGWYSVEVFQRPDQDTAIRKSIEYLRSIDI
ncbi:MAG TPA: sugar phosphate isomerase/epimerase [Clostridiaceae bacterium]|nr:sugar phosphate isomerase/epimerase [Clostridiaceae bacterium]